MTTASVRAGAGQCAQASPCWRSAAWRCFTALALGKVILAPICLAIVVGLMFGPVADVMERRGRAAGAFGRRRGAAVHRRARWRRSRLFAGPLSEWVAAAGDLGKAAGRSWPRSRGRSNRWAPSRSSSSRSSGAEHAMTVEVQDGGPVHGHRADGAGDPCRRLALSRRALFLSGDAAPDPDCGAVAVLFAPDALADARMCSATSKCKYRGFCCRRR